MTPLLGLEPGALLLGQAAVLSQFGQPRLKQSLRRGWPKCASTAACPRRSAPSSTTNRAWSNSTSSRCSTPSGACAARLAATSRCRAPPAPPSRPPRCRRSCAASWAPGVASLLPAAALVTQAARQALLPGPAAPAPPRLQALAKPWLQRGRWGTCARARRGSPTSSAVQAAPGCKPPPQLALAQPGRLTLGSSSSTRNSSMLPAGREPAAPKCGRTVPLLGRGAAGAGAGARRREMRAGCAAQQKPAQCTRRPPTTAPPPGPNSCTGKLLCWRVFASCVCSARPQQSSGWRAARAGR